MDRPIIIDKSALLQDHPYGYKYNINHPTIAEMYDHYKQSRGLPMHYPISDKARKTFEEIIARLIAAGKIKIK